MAEIADWRLTDKGGAVKKTGGRVATAQTNWWQVVLGSFAPGAGDPNILLATEQNREKVDRIKAELEDRGLLLQARGDLFPEEADEGSLADAQRVAAVFDIRDAILLDAAEALFNVEAGVGRRHPTRTRREARAEAMLFTDPADRSGGGGAGGGPKYVAPDRRVVEEFVGDKQIVLTGKRQPELNATVNAYMVDHRRQWEGQSVDPKQTVLEMIRGTTEYKRIHTLRGEATDENTWVNRRQDRLTQLGLTAKAAEARGIELAATGASLVDIGAGKFQAGKGRKDITMMNRLEKVAEQVGSAL